MTVDAAIWRGDDEELVASAMDMKDHLGRIWLTFAKGENPSRSAAFRVRLMAHIASRWPRTASLPVLPGGNIPLAADLIRTRSGYELKTTQRAKYDLPP